MTDRIVDVIVVGCGPVGATLANLLGRAGRTATVFEREVDVYHLPRAAHFDGEIMRVFQTIGLAEAIRPCTAPIDGMDFVDADGERLFGHRAGQTPGLHGWRDDFMFYQPDLETALRAGLDRYDHVDLVLGHEVTALAERPGHVEVTARDCATGTETTHRARYVVGTDGARSLTRAAIGAELDDYGFDQPWLVIDTFLRRPVDLPTVAVQYCDPDRPATFIPHGGTHRRWEIMAMPGDDLAELETPERVAELLAPWVRPDDVDVIRAVVYTFHALVARSWRRGRLLIAGDSAHQMPPFLGQGMCAGIRDAANLTWKLDHVLRGLASEPLLDTYQSEREPHARKVIETAVAAGRIIQTTDAEVARRRNAAFRAQDGPAPVGAFLPPLGPGVHGNGGGSPFPQVDGSDERLDAGFTVVHACDEPALASWFAERGADLALVRPDRYLFGTGRAGTLDTLRDALQAHLV